MTRIIVFLPKEPRVLTRVVVGAFTPSVLIAVARRRGRLDEVGLEVQEVPVSSSPAQFRSLLDGELDVALTSPDNVLAYRFSGRNPLGETADVRIVSAVDRGMGLALYGRPGLAGTHELRGARVGVDVPSSGFALALYAVAESLGLSPGDYELVNLGSTPKRLAALLDGSCDATMLNAGNELVAETSGCAVLARVTDVCRPYVGTVLSVVGDEHLADAERLAGALRRTAEDICTGEASEDARAEARQVLGLADALAGRYVARMQDPHEGLVRSALQDVDGLRTVVDLRRRYLPEPSGPGDVLDRALDPAAGLLSLPRDRRSIGDEA